METDLVLAEVSGRPNPKVHYEDIDQMLTKKEGIVIENWPYPKFENLSNVTSALPGLFELREKVRSGHIHFRKMSREEHEKWLEENDKGPKERKTRCDAGKKRVRADGDDSDTDEEGDVNVMAMGDVVMDEEEDELAPSSSKPKGKSKASSKKGTKDNEKSKGAKSKSKSSKESSTGSKSKPKSAGATEPPKKRQKSKPAVSEPSSSGNGAIVPAALPSQHAPTPVPTPIPVPSPSFFPVPDNPAPFTFAPPTSFAHVLNNPTVWNLALSMAQGKITTFPELENFLKKYLKDRFDSAELKPMTDLLFQDVENSVIEEDLRALMATYLSGFAPAEDSMDLSSSSSFFSAPTPPPQEFFLPDPNRLVDEVELDDPADGVRRSKRAPKPKQVQHLFSEFHPNTRERRN
ncbi:hypothetical protein AAF712_016046 [Marasmius tenuissimus]|uniref:Uncharacterized protein n=1 Tax=Marasmius tenuissimus TaxID=585030 RepID=A0ABR2ZA17_9AGAR